MSADSVTGRYYWWRLVMAQVDDIEGQVNTIVRWLPDGHQVDGMFTVHTCGGCCFVPESICGG